jgi:hypothetical protein
MAGPKRPIGILELHGEKYPASEGTTVHRFAEADLPDAASYEGGYKEGRLRGFSSIEQGVSTAGGDHFVAEARVEWDDTDHFTRSLLDQASDRYLGSGRDAIVKAVSDSGRRSGTAATVLLRGKTTALDPIDGLGAELIVQEFLASEFGPTPPEKTIPQRYFGRNVFRDLHRDLEAQVVPIVIGEALCPGYYVGDVTVSSTQQVSNTVSSSSLLPPPPAPTYAKFGSGGSKTWTYACCVRTTSGGRTTLGDSVTITGLPADGAFTPSNGVTLFLAQYAADLQAQIAGIDLYVKEGDADSLNAWHFVDAAGQMFNTAPGTPFAGGVGYDDDGDDSHHKGFNPPPTKNTAYVTTTEVVNGTTVTNRVLGRVAFCGHTASVVELWGSNGGADTTVAREQWPLGELADVIDPSHPDWPDANPYWDLVGADGVTERFFGIYVDKASPRLQHHIDGRITIVAKVCGCKQDANDATSPTIDQAFRAWQLLTSEWVVANGGKGYYTGAWAGLPQFADGVEMINSSSVDTAQDTSAALMGNATGFLSGFVLTEPIHLRDFYRLFNLQYCAWDYQNEFGQLCVGLINPYASPATGTLLRERIDDVVAIGAFKERRDVLENLITGQYDYDADQQTYKSDVERFPDVASQTAYKKTQTREVEARFTRDAATFRTAMQLRLLMFARPPYEGTMTLGTSGLQLGCFAPVRVTALEGLGAAGYTQRACRTMFRAIRLSEGEVDYRVWDLGRLLGSFFLQDGATREWGSIATNAATWGAITRTDGERWGSVYAG